ncbi:MAG: tetratricopeptide repeat protein [Caldilinea sp. CFX5]|nr:tetratricopeptide repeat protein [Caldilinea sp. CFX5]
MQMRRLRHIANRRLFIVCIAIIIILSLGRASSLQAAAARNIGTLYLLRSDSPIYRLKAKQWFQLSLVHNQVSWTYWLLGATEWREGNLDRAVSLWRTHDLVDKAIETALQQIERNPVERQQWEKQLITLPLSSTHWTRLGDIYKKLSEYSRAVESYQEALARIKQDPTASKADLFYELGNLYQFHFADPQKALAAYQAAATSADFKNRWSRVNTYIQTSALLLGHDNEYALQAAQQAVKAMPENVLAHTVLGLAIFNARGDLAAAEQAMITAAELEPTSVWPWMHRGQLYFQAQRYELAIEAYQHALTLAPDLAEANNMIVFIRANYLTKQPGND